MNLALYKFQGLFLLSLMGSAAIGVVLAIKDGGGASRTNNTDEEWVKIKNREEYLVDVEAPFATINGAVSYSCKYTNSADSTSKYSDTCRLVQINKAPKGQNTDINYVYSLTSKVKPKDFEHKNFKHQSFKLIVDKNDISDINFTYDGKAEIELVNRQANNLEQLFGKVKLTHKYEEGYYKGKVDSLLVRFKGSSVVNKIELDPKRCSENSTLPSLETEGFNCLLNEMSPVDNTDKYNFTVGIFTAKEATFTPNQLFTMQPFKPCKSDEEIKELTTESYSAKQDMFFKFSAKDATDTDATKKDESLPFELLGLVAHKKGKFQQALMIREF